MKKTVIALAACLAAGCGYGPDHLPALYAQRDLFQRQIDQVLEDMARNERWWSGLSEERRRHWTAYLEKARLDEKERALNAIEALNEGLAPLERPEDGQVR